MTTVTRFIDRLVPEHVTDYEAPSTNAGRLVVTDKSGVVTVFDALVPCAAYHVRIRAGVGVQTIDVTPRELGSTISTTTDSREQTAGSTIKHEQHSATPGDTNKGL